MFAHPWRRRFLQFVKIRKKRTAKKNPKVNEYSLYYSSNRIKATARGENPPMLDVGAAIPSWHTQPQGFGSGGFPLAPPQAAVARQLTPAKKKQKRYKKRHKHLHTHVALFFFPLHVSPHFLITQQNASFDVVLHIRMLPRPLQSD